MASLRAWRGRTAGLALVGATLAACASVGTSAAQASAPAYTISAFAGTGTAGPPVVGPATDSDLNTPEQVAVDASGNVYVADAGNYEVDKITPSGTLSIVAGNGTNNAPVPGQATNSPLTDPDGVAVDAAGDVYIADQNSGEVLKVTPAGTLSIIAGTGTQGQPAAGPATSSHLETPEGLAVDSAGDVYVADDDAPEVLKITPSGTLSIVAGTAGISGPPTAGPATSSSLDDPDGVALDSEGNLYIADAGSYVEKVDPAGNLSIFAGNGAYGNPASGPATSSPLAEPYGIWVDPAGNVDVADYNDIEQISPGGTLAIIAGDNTGAAPTYGQPGTSSPLEYPAGVAVSATGIVYVADTYNNTIDKLVPGTPASAAVPTITGSAVIGQTLTASDGSWSNEPTGYSDQWQDCDSSGASCLDIAGATSTTYTVSSRDAGHRIRVTVTAANGGGSASASSAATALIAALSTTTSPTTTTTTAPTSTSGAGVSIASTPKAGVTVAAGGRLELALVCPRTVSGCDADGTLAIALSTLHVDALHPNATTTPSSSVIAVFAGVQIQAGQSKLVAVTLSPAAVRYLQVHGVHRVRVTLTIHNHLLGGTSVTTSQKLWLNVASLVDACSSAMGSLTARGVGQLQLGMTHAQARASGRYRRLTHGFERYCLTAGSVRAAYPVAGLQHRVSTTQRHRDEGRVILALTANHHYSIRGIHTRAHVRVARQRLRLGHGITVGKNTWYFIRGRHATRVLKAQDGIIREIGVTVSALTHTKAAQRTLLHHL